MKIPITMLGVALAYSGALYSQEPGIKAREKMEPSALDLGLQARAIRSPDRLSGGEHYPSRGVEVKVEGRAIHIADLPEDALMAKARLNEIQGRSAESLAFLDSELSRLYDEQKKEITAARNDKAKLHARMDSGSHRDLWSLLREQALREGEANLQKVFVDQMEIQALRAEAGRQLMENHMRSYSVTAVEHNYNRQAEERGRLAAARITLAWEGAEFLRGLRPAWSDYMPRLEAYIQESVRLMTELEGVSQPLETRLLSRLLKIQLFERCRAIIEFSARVWSLAAAKVLTPRNFMDATATALRFTMASGRELPIFD